MAASSSSVMKSHGRSLSFPSQSSHPTTTEKFDETLSRIRSTETSCSSLSSMNDNLNTLHMLYSNMDDSLQFQLKECQQKLTDQILDGHIRLLDACSSAKDLVSQTKQDVQQLLSALRRKDVQGIHSYLTLRKRSKKMIEKTLRTLKSFRNKQNVLNLDNDHEFHMLKEAELVTISMLESLLSYMMGTKGQARQNSWSMISKFMINSKKVDSETKVNEFDNANAVLQMIEQEDDIRVEELMNHLKKMDSSIQDLEDGLECFFRKLIKTRVFLLNILNH